MKRRTFVRSTMAAVAASLPGRSSFDGLYRVVTQAPGDVDAVTGDGRKVTLKDAAIQELMKSLRGRLLLAKNEGYEQARQVLNPVIDKHPALIVQPTNAADVQSAVAFARASSLLVAVKCGGHSLSGQSTCDGGMLIDLSGLRGVRVDPAARKAWVAGGTLLGQVDRETQAHGLVTTMGTVSDTGVGGLTTGGGFGRVARRFGLALDNVTAVDVLTADGKVRHASKDWNEDLFWGVRGGGSNFGVVTSFEFQLHPLTGQVIGGDVVFPLAKAREVLSFYAEYSLEAPEELYLDYIMMRAPGGADGVVMLSACYSGPEGGADRALEPLRRLGTPLTNGIKALDYVALQRLHDDTDPRAMGTYLKGGFTSKITADLVKTILEGFEPHPARMTELFFQHCGGAIGRVAPEATAFAHRYAQHNMMAAVAWKAGTDSVQHVRWLKQYWAALERLTGCIYANGAPGDVGAAKVNANYRENYPRLVSIKRQYDPSNLFRLNANVKPTA